MHTQIHLHLHACRKLGAQCDTALVPRWRDRGRAVTSLGLRPLKSPLHCYGSRGPRRCIPASGNEMWDLGGM